MTLEQENAALRDSNDALEVENDTLKAHINSLREALEYLLKYALWGNTHAKAVMEKAFTSTPDQSLAEHDKKVIAEFRAKCIAWGSGEAIIDDEVLKHISKSIPVTTMFYTLPPIDNEEK